MISYRKGFFFGWHSCPWNQTGQHFLSLPYSHSFVCVFCFIQNDNLLLSFLGMTSWLELHHYVDHIYVMFQINHLLKLCTKTTMSYTLQLAVKNIFLVLFVLVCFGLYKVKTTWLHV